MDKEDPKEIELPLLTKSGKEKNPDKVKQRPKSQTSDPPKHGEGVNEFIPISSFIKYISFFDALPFIRKANSHANKIPVEDVPPPFTNFNCPDYAIELDKHWQVELKKPKPSLTRALYETLKWDLWYEGLLTFLVCNLAMFDTVILGNTVKAITNIFLHKEEDQQSPFLLGAIFSVSFLMKIFLENQYFYNAKHTSAALKYSVTGFMYKKLNTVSLTSLQQLDEGKIINLVTTDLNDLDHGLNGLWPMILVPYNVLVPCYLIWGHFGVLAVVAFGIIFGCISITSKITEGNKGAKHEKNMATDSRTKYTNELISCIRLIKLYAWEEPLRAIIRTLRIKELGLLDKLTSNRLLNGAVTEISIYLCIFSLCILYVLMGNVMSPDKVYATTALLNLVRRRVLGSWTQGRNFVVTAQLLIKRVEEVLAIKEVTALDVQVDQKRASHHHMGRIVLKDFTAYWRPNKLEMCLNNLTTNIMPGELTVVIGVVGSGKSTLLLSFLGEIPRTTGVMSFNGNFAYVEQEPIVFSQSVRDNITFGQAYDEEFYRKVLFACSLETDLEQFEHGDQTIVGERGVTLSGGQRARLSLARALYSRSDMYLLDDPLSAVDSKVANHIFEHAIRGMLKGKTVILVTHHLGFAKEADKLVVMEQGKIAAQGKYEEVQNSEINLLNMLTKQEPGTADAVEKKKKASVAKEKKEGKKIKLNERRQRGKDDVNNPVTWTTYKNYFKYCMNPWKGIVALILFVLVNCSVVALSRILGLWASEQIKTYHDSQVDKVEYEFDHSSYMFITTSLVLFIIVGVYLKGHLLTRFILEINTSLHSELLYKVSRATMQFFDETPVGQILSRFSTSMGTLDRQQPMNIYAVIEGLCSNLFFLIYICYNDVILALPAIIVLFGFFKVRQQFAKPLKELKKLDLQARSPMVSELSSTLNGLVIIRTYRQGAKFVKNFLHLIYQTSRVTIFATRVERFFSVSLFLLLYCLVMIGVTSFIHQAENLNVDPGMLGMALYYLIAVGSNSIMMIRQTMQSEIGMQNAENVMQYFSIPQEPPENGAVEQQLVKAGPWPSKGELVFKNVFMRYKKAEGVPYALNGVNFKIPAGSKVGLVGRTGAGKSSIIQVLFRMSEIDEKDDSTIMIDGTNIKDIGLQFLRKNLSIIPQTPVIFTGSLKKNLDPFNEHNDKDLWDALAVVRLKDYVNKLEKKLDTELGMGSSVLSAGQKQLLCLARVVLKKKKFVVLDEATANVDYETDQFIQDKIKEIFADSTILTVAHRLVTIAHYDKVIVLEKGEVAEYDHPYLLLVKTVGDKEITNEGGLFAQMVKNNGEMVSAKIFEIACTSYFNNVHQSS